MKIQNSSGSRIGAPVGHLLALAGARAYIHSREFALDHMVFCYGFCYCVWRDAV